MSVSCINDDYNNKVFTLKELQTTLKSKNYESIKQVLLSSNLITVDETNQLNTNSVDLSVYYKQSYALYKTENIADHLKYQQLLDSDLHNMITYTAQLPPEYVIFRDFWQSKYVSYNKDTKIMYKFI
jgi:hypothetical protein